MPPEKKLKAVASVRQIVEPYLMFRVHMHFKNNKKRHFYGIEWNCTVEQIYHKRVTEIVLNRENGYTDLLNFIETGKGKGTYKAAKIYMRTANGFDTLCRKYLDGKPDPEEINDPVFDTTNRILVLLPSIKDNIISVEPAGQVNFKVEL